MRFHILIILLAVTRGWAAAVEPDGTTTGVSGAANHIDFKAIVDEEFRLRHQDATEACESCVVPPAAKACGLAWGKLMGICNGADPGSDLGKFCKESMDDPKKFTVETVLRAKVNPIDVAYKICKWKSACPSGVASDGGLSGLWQSIQSFVTRAATQTDVSADQAALDALLAHAAPMMAAA